MADPYDKTYGFRLPKALSSSLESDAAAHGESLTKTLRRILEQWYGVETTPRREYGSTTKAA